MSVLSRPAITPSRPTLYRGRRRVRSHSTLAVLGALVVVLALAGVAALYGVRYLHDDSRRDYLGANGWPTHGQASYAVGTGAVQAGPGQRPVPIASVAKVMTAYLVLQASPLVDGTAGFRFTVSAGDVADTAVRRQRDESVVPVRTGEQLTERQALEALLLPSANNVAIMLARYLGGTVSAFVGRMNATARSLGMSHTSYTDPSGFLASTVSTSADQVVLARMAMRNATFADLVARHTARLPVAGTVHTTDTLLGTHGFIGIKTGSMDTSGGCFMFATRRTVGGRAVLLIGVVLGQHGHSLIAAGLYAARQLADRVAPSA